MLNHRDLQSVLCRVTLVCALAALAGCAGDDAETPVTDDWFAYFRLTQSGEAHLYIRGEWELGLLPETPMSRDGARLPPEHRVTIQELFENGIGPYESDSMSTSGADMGECDPSASHRVVHTILINPDPLVGAQGYGCWSTDEPLTETTQRMLERMEGMLHSLTGGAEAGI
jgi:hypothetical protein